MIPKLLIAVKEKLFEDNRVFMRFPITPPNSSALNTQFSKQTIKKCAGKPVRPNPFQIYWRLFFLISIVILVIRHSMEYHHK